MAKRELLATMRDHYRSSSKKDKSRILDECIAVTGHHRKHGIKLLGKRGDDGDTSHPVRSRRIYDEAVREAVIVIWEAADRIWGKWLKSALPHLLESMERHGHLALDPEVRECLLATSASTSDRLLKPVRAEAALSERRATLDPVALLHAIREAQSALASIVSPELRPTPQGESLKRFLARLPGRWLEEQEHADRKPRAKAPHTWRTRQDLFEGVCCDVVGWSQEDPDASAVALLSRLQETEPDRFSRAHLRTLQRRVQQWRGITVNKLVYAAFEATLPDPDGMPEIALTTDDPKC